MGRNGLPKVDRVPDAVPATRDPEVEEFRRYQFRTMPPGVRQKWLSAEAPTAAEDEFFDTLPPQQTSTTDPTLITRRRPSRWPSQIAIALTILFAAFIAVALAMRWTSPPPSVAPPAPSVHRDPLPPPPANTAPPAQTSAPPPAKTSALPPAKTSALPPAKTSALPPAKTSALPPAKSSETPAPAHTSPLRPAPAPAAPAKSIAPKPIARPPAPPAASSAGVDTKTPFF